MQKIYISSDGKILYQVSKDYKGKVTIPEGVETIAKRAFANCEQVTEIELPYSLLEIGEEAFRNCVALSRIEIPVGVQRIPDKCFGECKNLVEVVLPEGILSLGYESFWACSSLSSINFPHSLREIGDSAFLCCRSLKAIEIGPRLQRIQDYAFQNSGISTIRIGASEKPIRIGVLVFWGTKLQRIEVDPENEFYTDAGCNVIMEKKTGRVICGSSISKIPDTATVIADSAFGVTPKELLIPSSVKRIGNCAFGCNGCRIRLSEGVEVIEEAAFQPTGYPGEPTTVEISSSVREIQEQLAEIDFQIDPANKYYHYDQDGQNIISNDGKLVWGRLLGGIPAEVKELHVTVNHELDFSKLIIPENVRYVSPGIFGVDCCFFEKILVFKGTRVSFPDDWESDCEIVVVSPTRALLSGAKGSLQYDVFPEGTPAEELERALMGNP